MKILVIDVDFILRATDVILADAFEISRGKFLDIEAESSYIFPTNKWVSRSCNYWFVFDALFGESWFLSLFRRRFISMALKIALLILYLAGDWLFGLASGRLFCVMAMLWRLICVLIQSGNGFDPSQLGFYAVVYEISQGGNWLIRACLIKKCFKKMVYFGMEFRKSVVFFQFFLHWSNLGICRWLNFSII